jgi:DNA-binding PadR family transcriptional regulator
MILGLVKWMQPVHGYDVRRELLSWQAEDWANVAPGSIYHALRKLTDEGLLEEVSTEQVGARPARTTYRITAKGDAEFDELLRRYWWEYRQPVDPFLAGFGFCRHCRGPRRPPRSATGCDSCGPRSSRIGSRSPPNGCGRRSRPTWAGCSS